LISITGNEDVWKWWGLNDCVEGFIKWIEERIDMSYGTNLSKNKKRTEINMWTYNGMKFDLVFLVKRLIDFLDFLIQESITGTSLKGLKVANIIFRD